MVALNWGAKHNRERLTTGHGWSVEQVERIIGTLDKKDLDFVQGIWDHIGSKWSEVKAQDQRLFGSELEQRETVPMVTKHGVYKGGYLPIKYDPRASVRFIIYRNCDIAHLFTVSQLWRRITDIVTFS